MKNNPVLVDERPVLLLASASPRRREYIELLGIPYCCEPAEVDETIIGDFDPMEHAEKVAQRKADTVANKHPGRYVLGADTIVVWESLRIRRMRLGCLRFYRGMHTRCIRAFV